jgi:hypothetical protein
VTKNARTTAEPESEATPAPANGQARSSINLTLDDEAIYRLKLHAMLRRVTPSDVVAELIAAMPEVGVVPRPEATAAP